VPVSTALEGVLAKVQLAFERKETVTGTPTGFTDLDRKTAGWQEGDLIILAARPAMGKTAFALNLAANAGRDGKSTVALFSLEMPTNQLAARMLACDARVDSERMRSGNLVDGDIDRLLVSVRRMNAMSIQIDDTPGATVMEIRSKCRRLASDRSLPPLGLVIIDYLQLMKGKASANSREQEISDISRNLKTLAKELKIPVIALSQLNRGVESRPNKRPMMSDLRESGAIEQDADIIMFVYRDEYYNEDTEEEGITEIIIGKQRNGPIGTVKLRFFKQWSRFVNLHPDG
jgi:replicative DNA helicase